MNHARSSQAKLMGPDAKEAGLTANLPAEFVSAPAEWLRKGWDLAGPIDQNRYEMELFSPLTITINRYGRRSSCIAETNTNYSDLRNLIESIYRDSGLFSDEAHTANSGLSCFTMEIREGHRVTRNGSPYGKADFKYLIGSKDCIDFAANLVMQYNYEKRFVLWMEGFAYEHALQIVNTELRSSSEALALSNSLPRL